MKAMSHFSIQNDKDNFNFVFYLQQGATWAAAKAALSEIYEEIIRQEQLSASKANADQNPAQEVAGEVVQDTKA